MHSLSPEYKIDSKIFNDVYAAIVDEILLKLPPPSPMHDEAASATLVAIAASPMHNSASKKLLTSRTRSYNIFSK
jgi:hypothetical protein